MIGGPVLHYSVQDRLGSGGMGVVYRAVDTRLDRPVALKFLPDSLSLDGAAKERLRQEARAAARLDHPNIGVIHDIEEADGQLFIVMALYEGESLKERLARDGLSVPEAVEVALQVAHGLHAAHELGLIHRDIKPANLFITRERLVKILDFGLVKQDQAEGLTMPGTILGTPEYMSPEQVRGQGIDRRSDVWSLGTVLYEMITGVSPFRASGDLPAVMMQIVNGQPAALSEFRPDAPEALQAVVTKALAKPRDERYPSAAAFARDLEALATTDPARGAGARADAMPHQGAPTGATSGRGARAGEAQEAESSLIRQSIADLALDRPGAPQASALLEPVPKVPRFIGRSSELEATQLRLERDRLVAVRGIAGTGKSAFGAKLARERVPEEQIFWFTFDSLEKNGVDALFWSLAAFLRGQGETLLWRYLQGEIEAHKPLDMTVRVNLFLSSLSSECYVFCFDDVHLVKDVPEVAELLKVLDKHVTRQDTEFRACFVLMGRALPPQLDFRAQTLAGFTLDETRALLEANQVASLEPALIRRLRERTGGNPTVLELAVHALARLQDDRAAQVAFIDSMTGRGDIRDYVMRHIYADLPETEKGVLDALSIFPGTVELELAEEALAEEGLREIVPCVDSLVQKSVVHEAANGQIYCHELVREFCYRSLDRTTKRRLHERVASYYEQRGSILRAAHHYFELGESERALRLLTENVQPIIQAGGASSLIEQLERVPITNLDEDQQLAVQRAIGEANYVRGEFRRAAAIYEEALDDAFEESDQAELLCRIASSYERLAQYQKAVDYASRSLEIFQLLGDDSGVAQVQRVLGWAQYRLGQLEPAREAFEAGRELGEKVGDRWLLAQVQQGLGVIELRLGRLDEARQLLDASRRAFRELRDRIGEAEAAGNLAWVYGRLGNTDRELTFDRKVLEILEHVGDVGNLLIAYNNTGDLYHRSGRHAEAIEQYELLAALAQRIEHTVWQVAADLGLAENYLALGRLDDALQRALQAHQLAGQVSDPGAAAIELAMSSRVLGDVHLALERFDAAAGWYRESIPSLEEASEEEELAKARHGLELALAGNQEESSAPEREGAYEQAR